MASSSETNSSIESETPISVNSFANDGSFLETYKQKLKEMENVKNGKKEEADDEEKRKTMNLLLQVWTVFWSEVNPVSTSVFC